MRLYKRVNRLGATTGLLALLALTLYPTLGVDATPPLGVDVCDDRRVITDPMPSLQTPPMPPLIVPRLSQITNPFSYVRMSSFSIFEHTAGYKCIKCTIYS